MADADSVLVTPAEVREFITRCLRSAGAGEDHSRALADVLVTADERGHYSHGLNRLDMYIKDIQRDLINLQGEPEVFSERAATAYVNGQNILGPVVGNFCMQLAIRKAKEAGVGWVVATGSNHYGIAGWYSMQASEQSLLGMSFTNTSPIQIPTRGKESILGTNPISVAAPASGRDSFVLDMATSTVALGKVEMNERKKLPIPDGWAADKHGKETNDPSEMLNGGGLLPLGGSELSGGYKGYGLALMVEIFTGILAGSHWGPHIRHWKQPNEVADLGQCFVAIDPTAFAPGFAERLQDLLDECRGQEPAQAELPVLVPGDPERMHIEKCTQQGGITYHRNVINVMNEIADNLQVPKLQYS